MSGRVERKANNMHKEDGSETEIQKELITIKGIVDGMTSREYLNRETSAAEDQKKKRGRNSNSAQTGKPENYKLGIK